MKITHVSYRSRLLRRRSGFTLVEMLIVVTIIGVIIGIGVPALRDAKDKAAQAKIDSVIANVATAKTRYLLDNNTTTSAFDGMTDPNRWNAIRPYLLNKGVMPATGATGMQDFTAGTGQTSLTVNNSTNAPTVP